MKVSFILNGSSATKVNLESLAKKVESLNAGGDLVEVVLYSSNRTAIHRPARSVSFVTPPSKIPLIQKAIVIASGERLVFTTIDNLLADKENSIFFQALDPPLDQISAPLVKNLFGKIGFARTIKTSYVITGKAFIAELANNFSSFTGLLAYAAQSGSLAEIQQVNVSFPKFIILDQSLLNSKASPKKEAPATKTSKVKPIKYSSDIPVFIICRDRVEPLKQLVKWCEDEGLSNIIFIDNASTYPPLLNYFASTKYDVVRLNQNVGFLSPWQTGAVTVYAKDRPYVVSDADVIPSPKSHGAIKLFCQLLNKYPERIKAGFGLRIDDIPDCYEPKKYVVAWENQFWQKEVEKDVYDADIDTTFALWRQNTLHAYGPSLRTGGKYVAKHDTWYLDSLNLSEEMRYYREHADKIIGTWGTDSVDLHQSYIANHKKNKPKSKRAPKKST